MNPFVFDNTYFQEVLLGSKGIYLKTEADLNLLNDPSLKKWVEAYAEDQDLFFDNYARAHVKISERGQEENLMSEFDEADIINGGYQELKGQHWTNKYSKGVQESDAKEVQIWLKTSKSAQMRWNKWKKLLHLKITQLFKPN